MRTRAGDFILRCGTTLGDTTSVTITHNDPGTATVDWIGSEYTATSASPVGFYWPQDHDGLATVRFSNFTAYATELEIEGMIGLEIGQIPPQLTRFEHNGGYFTYDGLTMSGTSLPSGLIDLHVENIRSSADVDRIITALEANGASSGNLFLAEQTLSKTTDLLESRSWDVEVEPQFVHKVERSKAPHTSVIDGKAVHHVDRRRGGDRRRQQPKYGFTTNGTSDLAERAYVRPAHTAATICISVNDAGSAANDRWVAVGGTAGGIDIVYTADGFDVIVAADASNYTTYQYDGGALSGRHEIGVTVSGSTVTCYLDGDAVTTTPANTGTGYSGTIPATERIRIGADAADSAANHSAATFDDFRYFDVALAAERMSQIGKMRPNSLSGFGVGVQPIHWLDFERGGTGSSEPNKGSSGSAFTLTGTVSALRGTTSDRYSYANEVGYTEGDGTNGAAVGEIISADPTDLTKDMEGNDLQYQGPVPRDSVISSPAVELNGTSEFVDFPVSLAGSSSWSVRWKMKTSDAGATVWCARDGNDDGYRFYFDGNAYLSSDATDLILASHGFADGEWHEFETSWDGATGTLRVDGAEVLSGALPAAASLSATGIRFGDRLYLTGSALDGQIADIEITVDGVTQGTWPMCESSGDICWDISGNGNHGTNAPTARTGSQNASDVLITSGFAKGTWFDGSSDSLDKTGRITSGTITELSGCCFAVMDSAKVQTICSEYLFTGDQRSWNWRFNASRQMELVASPDGTGGATQATSPVVADLGQLVHVGFSYSAGTIKWYVNGALVETDTGAYASFGDVTCNFMIGNTLTAQFLHGMLSKLVIEQAVWSDAEFASLKAATDEASILAIRPGATVYIDGGISDSSLTVVGAPEERIIPAGAGIPISYGPGVPAPGQSRLVAAEPNSPFALRYAQDYTLESGDLVYEAVFPGSSNWVDLGSTLIGATDDFDVSFEVLVNAFPGSGTESIISQFTGGTPGRFTVNAVSTGVLRYFIDNGASDVSMDSSPVSSGKWHLVRITRVGDVFSLYVNDALEATQTQAGVSVEQSNTTLGNDPSNGVGDFNGRLRTVRIDNNGTVTELLTEGIGLPGATLTNVTLSSKPAGAIGGRILFQNSDDTANLYESPMSAEMADIIASRKYS